MRQRRGRLPKGAAFVSGTVATALGIDIRQIYNYMYADSLCQKCRSGLLAQIPRGVVPEVQASGTCQRRGGQTGRVVARQGSRAGDAHSRLGDHARSRASLYRVGPTVGGGGDRQPDEGLVLACLASGISALALPS